MSKGTFLVSCQWRTPIPVVEPDLTWQQRCCRRRQEEAKHFAWMKPGRQVHLGTSQLGEKECSHRQSVTNYVSSWITCTDHRETSFAARKWDYTEMWIVDLSELSSVKKFVDKRELPGRERRCCGSGIRSYFQCWDPTYVLILPPTMLICSDRFSL